jgi:hypothetical protein
MSTTETKKATVATSQTINGFFQEAMRSYENALKAGTQLQEESVNLWKDLLSKLGSPEELQAKLDAGGSLAARSFNCMSKQTTDLFEKTLGVYQAISVTDAQRRVQDLIESSLTALRISVHGALNTLELLAREVVSVGLDSRPELIFDLPAVEGSNHYTALWKALESA